MKMNIFIDNRIPIVLIVIGILIISSDFIKLNSMRKVTLKQRTRRRKGLIIRILNDYIINLLHKNRSYNLFLEKMQFYYGYFSAESERNNRINAEKMILKLGLINLIIVLGVLLTNGIWLSKIVTIAVILLFEYLFIRTSVTKKREKLRDQFPIMVREFIEGYALTYNVKESFEYIVKEIPPVYKVHVNRLINQMSSTSQAEEAFSFFAKRVGYSMCSNFVSIVESAYSTKKNIIDSLIEFQSMINKEIAITKGNKAKTKSQSNTIVLWIIVCIIEIYAVGTRVDTATGNYFFTTQQGQNLLFLTILAIIIGIAAMRISDSI